MGEVAGSAGMSTTLPATSNFHPVIHAAQAAFLVPREEQVHTPVRAVAVKNSDPPAAVAEGDQILAEKS